MFDITLICMGKLKEKFYLSAAEEYAKRLKGYCNFHLIELPEHRLPEDPSPAEIAAGLDKEAELMQQVIAEELAEEMKHVEELLDVAEEDLTLAQKLARAYYCRRLSTKERRKLKRLRKKMKNGKNRK